MPHVDQSTPRKIAFSKSHHRQQTHFSLTPSVQALLGLRGGRPRLPACGEQPAPAVTSGPVGPEASSTVGPGPRAAPWLPSPAGGDGQGTEAGHSATGCFGSTGLGPAGLSQRGRTSQSEAFLQAGEPEPISHWQEVPSPLLRDSLARALSKPRRSRATLINHIKSLN